MVSEKCATNYTRPSPHGKMQKMAIAKKLLVSVRDIFEGIFIIMGNKRTNAATIFTVMSNFIQHTIAAAWNGKILRHKM